jgi:hypothetical protein
LSYPIKFVFLYCHAIVQPENRVGNMTPESAARIFHDWSEQEGLLSEGPKTQVRSTQAETAAVQPVSEPGKQALRSKQIQAIGFDESRNEVIVFLRRAAPRSKKALTLLPSRIDDVKISDRQGSPDTVGHLPPAPFGSPPYSVRQTVNGDRYTCGSSISVGNCRDAGTLGCLVRDGQNALFGLSNNHVSASCSFAGIELPILAPGVCDVAPRDYLRLRLAFTVDL